MFLEKIVVRGIRVLLGDVEDSGRFMPIGTSLCVMGCGKLELQ